MTDEYIPVTFTSDESMEVGFGEVMVVGSSTPSSSAWIAEVSLPASAWEGSDRLWHQVVTIEGTTKYSQVDLTPSAEQLTIFHEKDIAFTTENEDGTVTVFAIGDKPSNDYTIQATITEVSV